MSTLGDIEARRVKWAAIFAAARAHPTSRSKDSIPADPHRVRSMEISVSGPISWSWYWPKAPVESTLKRAASSIRRLSVANAPYGVYRVTIDGTTREVVRSAREDV